MSCTLFHSLVGSGDTPLKIGQRTFVDDLLLGALFLLLFLLLNETWREERLVKLARQNPEGDLSPSS